MPYAPTIGAFPVSLACNAFPHNRRRTVAVSAAVGAYGIRLELRRFAI